MKFLCLGMGAIGTYIGGSLALSGQPVVFVERPEVAAEVIQRGMRLRVSGIERRLDNPTTVSGFREAMALGPFDVAILAVKSFDTPAILSEILPFRDSFPPVLCLQNGVDNEPAIAAALGANQVIAGTVTTAVGRRAAGDITVEKLRGVGVAIEHPLGRDLAAVMNAAGLRVQTYPNAADMKWSKMLTNLLANASSAILDLPPAVIFAHPGLYNVEVRMLKEALEVMAAHSIGLTDLPSTPVRLLIGIIRFFPAWLSRPILVQSLGKGRGDKMPSFHIDLYEGRNRSEVDYLNGAVVRYGKQAGVAAPVNQWLTQTLLAMTEGRLPRELYAHQPEKMIADLQKGSSQ